MDLAQGKVAVARILRVGNDARGTTLFEVAGLHQNQECELLLPDERVIEAEFLVARKKRTAVTHTRIRGRYQSAARQCSVICMGQLACQLVDLRWGHGKGIDLKC